MNLYRSVSLARGVGAARMLFSRQAHVASGTGAGGGSSGGGGHGTNGGAGRSGGSGGSGGFRRQLGLWSMMAIGGQLAILAGSAHAAKGKEVASKDLTVESVVDALWSVSGPILTNLGFSGCVGVAAGMALKKIGQFMAFIIGMSFLALQGLAYAGVVTVNWTNVHGQVNRVLDVNKDGKLDKDDFKFVVSQGLGVLAQGVPSVAGFLGGFMIGMRM